MLTRGLTMAAAALAGLVVLELGLRLHARLTDPAPGSLEQRLVRSEVSQPAAEPRATSLRGLVRRSTDPELVYELKPNLEARFKATLIRTNRFGLRGPDRSLAKPPGTLRIVGLGDSVMFGWGVEEEESYPRLLERCLEKRAPPAVEVLNFAVPGYNTWMEIAAFESKAAAFEPDLVLLHPTANDLNLPRFMEEPVEPWRWDFLATARYVRRALGRAPVPAPFVAPPQLRRLPEDRSQRVSERYSHMVGADGVRRALEKLARHSEQLGNLPVLMVLGSQQEAGGLFASEAQRLGFRLVSYDTAFSDHLAAAGDVGTEAWKETFWVSANDSHPNRVGHALIAEVLRRKLGELWGTDRVCSTLTAAVPTL